jgi:hypothetical protein
MATQLMPPLTEKDKARFWKRVHVSGPEECWPWLGYTDKGGYGTFTLGRKTSPRRCHRVAWEITSGKIPSGLCILHRCDNPTCCNSAHLWVGTKGENNTDRAIKGRSSTGAEHYARRHPERLARGEASGAKRHPERLARGAASGAVKASRFSECDIREIRKLSNEGMRHHIIAERFRVCRQQVSKICLFKAWKHVS